MHKNLKKIVVSNILVDPSILLPYYNSSLQKKVRSKIAWFLRAVFSFHIYIYMHYNKL